MKIKILLLIFSIIFLVCYIIKLFNLSYQNEHFNNNKINIIQTWKPKEIPDKYKSLVNKIKTLNPTYNYIRTIDNYINPIVSVVIIFYNILIFFTSLSYMNNSKIIIILILVNILNYIILYYHLSKLNTKNFKS